MSATRDDFAVQDDLLARVAMLLPQVSPGDWQWGASAPLNGADWTALKATDRSGTRAVGFYSAKHCTTPNAHQTMASPDADLIALAPRLAAAYLAAAKELSDLRAELALVQAELDKERTLLAHFTRF